MTRHLMTTKIIHSIYSSEAFINNFAKEYKLDYKGDIDMLMNEYFLKYYNVSSACSICTNEKTMKSTKIKPGDNINISYMPDSQKYLDIYPDISGTVMYVDDKEEDLLLYTIDNNILIVFSAVRQSCGTGYGNSCGYDYFITVLT